MALTPAQRAQARADAAVRRGAREALTSTREAEEVLATQRRALTLELRRLARRSLRLGTHDPLPRSSEREIARTVEQATTATRAARVRTIIDSIARTLRTGPQTSRSIADLLTHGTRPVVRVLDVAQSQRLATRLTHNRRLAVRGVSLSRRMHAVDTATRAAMEQSLTDSLRAGRSVRASAERLLLVEDRGLRVALPRYVTDIRDAVRAGVTGDELRDVVRSHARQVQRLTDNANGLRQSARAFMSSAADATATDIDRAIEHFVYDKARYLEQRIVRTEGQRALAEAFVASTHDQPWTIGYRWNLSGGHPHEDVCDVYAGSDAEGLGEGGYSEEALPDCPAHSHCMCFITSIIDDDYEARADARARGAAEPPRPWESGERVTPVDWLSRLPADQRRRILGPGRDDLFDTHPTRVVAPNGSLRPLWQAEGRSRPAAPRSSETRRISAESRMRSQLRVEGDDARDASREARLDEIDRARR